MGSLRVGHDWATSLSRIGEGNGNPLQCSCLENPRDGGAWWAAVYGVTQSQTRLKRRSSSSSSSWTCDWLRGEWGIRDCSCSLEVNPHHPALKDIVLNCATGEASPPLTSEETGKQTFLNAPSIRKAPPPQLRTLPKQPPRLRQISKQLEFGARRGAGALCTQKKLRIGKTPHWPIRSQKELWNPPPPLSSVQSLSRVRLFATPWTAASQSSLSITNSWSLLKLMSIESMMPSNHLILCRPFLLAPSIFPSIRVFSNASPLIQSLSPSCSNHWFKGKTLEGRRPRSCEGSLGNVKVSVQ